MSLGEGNILLDGLINNKIWKTLTNHVEIKGTNTQGYIRTGKTSVTDTTSGFWLNNNSDLEFSVGSWTNFLKYDGGSLSIETQQLELKKTPMIYRFHPLKNPCHLEMCY